MTTKFFDDYFPSFTDIVATQSILNENEVAFKLQVFSKKPLIQMVIVQNDDASKLEKGVKKDKGSTRIYFFPNGAIAFISSYYGWSGRGEGWSTQAFLKVLFDNEGAFTHIIKMPKLRLIKDYEAEFKKVIGIKTTIPKVATKQRIHKNLDDFMNDDPELFKKMIIEPLKGRCFISHPGALPFHDNQSNLNTNIVFSGKLHNGSKSLLDFCYSTIFPTLTKIVKTSPNERLSFLYRALKDLNIAHKVFTTTGLDDTEINCALCIFSNDFTENDCGFINEFLISHENNAFGSLKYVDDKFVFVPEAFISTADALLKITEMMSKKDGVYQSELVKILASIPA